MTNRFRNAQIQAWQERRKDLKIDLHEVKTEQVRAWIRKELAKCDKALNELAVFQEPLFPCPAT